MTVSDSLVEAAQLAVKEGRSPSVSAFFGEAMDLRPRQDARLEALSRMIEEYEQLHGVITDDELAEQEQRDRDAAASLRSLLISMR